MSTVEPTNRTAAGGPSASRTTRVFAVVGLTIAVVLAWANGVLAWAAPQLAFLGESPDRGDYVSSAVAALAGAGVLAIGLVALFAFRPPVLLVLLALLAIASLLGLAVISRDKSRTTPPDPDLVDSSWWEGAQLLFLPGSWPLLAVTALAVVVVIRRRRRRS